MMLIRSLDIESLLHELGIPLRAENPLRRVSISTFLLSLSKISTFILLFPQFNRSAGEAGYGAFQKDHHSFFFDARHREIPNGHLHVSHMASHPATLNSPLGRSRTVGTRSPKAVFLAVALRTAVKAVTFDHALKTPAPRLARHLDLIPLSIRRSERPHSSG